MESEKATTGWISSTELLANSGISRSTLNNYIKMGMIPPPIVKKPDNPYAKARQIGYFVDTVLDTIARIRLYKEEGHTIKEIRARLSREQNVFLKDPDDLRRSDDSLSQLDPLNKMIPSLISFSVLVAKLQDSDRIRAELPLEEYFMLMGQIWASMEGPFERYHGTHKRQTRYGMKVYFIKNRNFNYQKNTIDCAIDLRKNMKELSDQWKTNKRWLNDLQLNIGINEGEEYWAMAPESTTNEFTPMGDTEPYAAELSDFSRDGSIWATKNLMNRLTEEEKTQICYGIRRSQQQKNIVIENVFSRIMDLIPPDDAKHFQFMDIKALPVTEIFHRR